LPVPRSTLSQSHASFLELQQTYAGYLIKAMEYTEKSTEKGRNNGSYLERKLRYCDKLNKSINLQTYLHQSHSQFHIDK